MVSSSACEKRSVRLRKLFERTNTELGLNIYGNVNGPEARSTGLPALRKQGFAPQYPFMA